jgi:hypothetical protein
MSDLWPLLTGEPLNGDTVIHRQLRPAGCAVPVDRTDLESAAHAVIGLCNSWGGSAMPLIPVTPHTPIDSRWHRILLQSSIDGIAKTDLRAGAAQDRGHPRRGLQATTAAHPGRFRHPQADSADMSRCAYRRQVVPRILSAIR